MTSVSSLSQSQHHHRKHATKQETDPTELLAQSGIVAPTKTSTSASAVSSAASDSDTDDSSDISISNDALSKFADILSKLMMALQNSSDAGDSSSDSASSSDHPNGPPSAAELTKKLDTDGDGKISKDEFVTGRPKDVSEADAAKKFAAIDKDNKGSITGEQMAADMKAHGPGGPGGAGGPPPGPPPEEADSDTDATSSTASTTDTSKSSADAILKQILAAIEAYRAHSEQTSTTETAA